MWPFFWFRALLVSNFGCALALMFLNFICFPPFKALCVNSDPHFETIITTYYGLKKILSSVRLESTFSKLIFLYFDDVIKLSRDTSKYRRNFRIFSRSQNFRISNDFSLPFKYSKKIFFHLSFEYNINQIA